MGHKRTEVNMNNAKKFNHAFDVAFEVANSDHENWEDCLVNEPEKVFAALFIRMSELFAEKEYLEAITGFDTYEHEEEAVEETSKYTKIEV